MQNTPIPKILVPLYQNDDLRLSHLINSLTLFDKVIIDSRHLNEIRVLSNTFGITNVQKLLRDGFIEIKGGHITTGVQTLRVLGNDILFLVRPFQLEPNSTREKNIESLSEHLEPTEDHKIIILARILDAWRRYNRDKLINTVLEVYKDYSDEGFSEFTDRVHGFISETSFLKDSLLQKSFQNFLNSDDSNKVQIFREGREIYRINLNRRISSQRQSQLIQNFSKEFLLGMANIIRNNFNELYFNSMIGYKSDEIDFQKINSQYIFEKFDPDQHLERHERVLNVNNLPIVEESSVKEINFKNLHKALKSKEIQEFRNWLWNVDNLDDSDLIEKVNSFRKYADKILRVPILKGSLNLLQSFVVSNSVGDPTGASGELSGSLIDQYIFKKIMRKDHFTFINDIYPSIFEQ